MMILNNKTSESPARILRESLHLKRKKNIPITEQYIKEMEQGLSTPFEEIHKNYGPFKLFKQGMDQHTNLHKKIYELHTRVKSEYLAIVNIVISELIKEPCFVQKIPTYRFGVPHNRWVGAYHVDSDFGHSKYELNCILAFTNMHNTAALQVEEMPHSYKYKPMELSRGELILFNHIDRRHGCCLNREGLSVASIDFRFIPERFSNQAFQNTGKTINTKIQLLPGAYFSRQYIAIN